MSSNQQAQHDSLADMPINSVLIGVFAETLNKLGHINDGEFPESINIDLPGTTKTANKTFMFKTADVRKYLEELKGVIDLMVERFLPRGEPTPLSPGMQTMLKKQQLGENKKISNSTQKRKSMSKSQSVTEEPELTGESDMPTESTEEPAEENQESVAELEDEQPSTGASNKGASVMSPVGNKTSQNKPEIMTGGKHKKAPKRKLSLKKRKN